MQYLVAWQKRKGGGSEAQVQGKPNDEAKMDSWIVGKCIAATSRALIPFSVDQDIRFGLLDSPPASACTIKVQLTRARLSWVSLMSEGT